MHLPIVPLAVPTTFLLLSSWNRRRSPACLPELESPSLLSRLAERRFPDFRCSAETSQ